MTDQRHLERCIRDLARIVDRVDPAIADAALAHLFAGTIARMAANEEFLNPAFVARMSLLRRAPSVSAAIRPRPWPSRRTGWRAKKPRAFDGRNVGRQQKS
jgi:hypothetical protein